tara:strand:+ start:1469 stop:1684 length:216 start_codon:yes stop_codon:yes gene_type:complete
MTNLLAAASLNLNEAWNMSWGEGIQFLIVLIILYWIKVQIDTRAGLGKKKANQLRRIIVEALKEAKEEKYQ